MKLSTQVTAVIITAIVALAVMVGLLAQAGWKEGSIGGLVTGIATAVGGIIVLLRKQQQQGDQLDDQDVKLDRIMEQTNGLSEQERHEIAERAAAAVVRQFRGNADWQRGGGHG